MIAAIISLLIPIAIFSHFIKEKRKHPFLKKRDFFIILIGLIYLIFAALLFSWSIDVLEFSYVDFLIIYATVIVIQTISLISILYQQVQNKKIFYSLLAFTLVIPLMLFKTSYIHLVIPISLFITLLSFLIFADEHEEAVRYITLYSSIALFAYLISLSWPNTVSILNLITTILFLLFIRSFLKSIRTNPSKQIFKPHKEESPIIHFLKHFIFIIIITNFIFIGTISVHELGHLGIAKTTGCQDIKIIYEGNGFPHTEVNCEDTSKQMQWVIGGIALPFFIALLLFLSGGTHIKEMAMQIVGFNLIISYLDIQALGLSKTIAVFGLILGATFATLGLILLIRSRVEY